MNALRRRLKGLGVCSAPLITGMFVAGCGDQSPATVAMLRSPPAQSILVPEVPEALNVPAGNRASSHVHVQGVQIYAWRAAADTGLPSWTPVGTQAALFSEDGKLVGYQCRGPTWESKRTGMEVRGKIVVTHEMDMKAIPWQLIQATNAPGPGMARTTYILRIHTEGGLPPPYYGEHEGQIARQRFWAEDFFFRSDE